MGESPVEESVVAVAEDVMTWGMNSIGSTCTPRSGVASLEMKSISDDTEPCLDIVSDGMDELGN